MTRYPFSKVVAVRAEEWEQVKNDSHTILSTEIPFITQLGEYHEPPDVLVVNDNDGNKWGGKGSLFLFIDGEFASKLKNPKIG